MNRIVQPRKGSWSVAAANAILALRFSDEDFNRMNELARRARSGKLTAEETAESDSYERIGHLLDMMHSKARRSLARTANPSPRRDG